MKPNTRTLLLYRGIFALLSLFLAGLFFSNLVLAQTVLFNHKINSDSSYFIHNEEQVAINPANPDNVVAVWRDFRLGYRQVGVGYSTDAGISWTDYLIGIGVAPYPWETDPGITTDLNGNFYTVTLCLDPPSDQFSTSAICVYKSTDGGVTWQNPVVVVEST